MCFTGLFYLFYKKVQLKGGRLMETTLTFPCNSSYHTTAMEHWQWGSNERKQIVRWQHLSQMKNVKFFKTDNIFDAKNAAGYHLGPVAPSAFNGAALKLCIIMHFMIYERSVTRSDDDSYYLSFVRHSWHWNYETSRFVACCKRKLR